VLLDHEQVLSTRSVSTVSIHNLSLKEGLVLPHFLLHQVLHYSPVKRLTGFCVYLVSILGIEGQALDFGPSNLGVGVSHGCSSSVSWHVLRFSLHPFGVLIH
jgi:hypothetical protein